MINESIKETTQTKIKQACIFVWMWWTTTKNIIEESRTSVLNQTIYDKVVFGNAVEIVFFLNSKKKFTKKKFMFSNRLIHWSQK